MIFVGTRYIVSAHFNITQTPQLAKNHLYQCRICRLFRILRLLPPSPPPFFYGTTAAEIYLSPFWAVRGRRSTLRQWQIHIASLAAADPFPFAVASTGEPSAETALKGPKCTAKMKNVKKFAN
jgi:hypothetical protein